MLGKLLAFTPMTPTMSSSMMVKKIKSFGEQIRLEASSSARSNSSSELVLERQAHGDKYKKTEEAKLKVDKVLSGGNIKVNTDGTYEIKFDDGERKSKVKSLYIRKGQ